MYPSSQIPVNCWSAPPSASSAVRSSFVKSSARWMAWRDDDVCHLLWFQCLQSMFVSTFAYICWYWILWRSSFVPVRMRLYPFCRWKIKFSSKARSCNTATECISKSLQTESKNQIYPLRSVGSEFWELVSLWLSSLLYHHLSLMSPKVTWR